MRRFWLSLACCASLTVALMADETTRTESYNKGLEAYHLGQFDEAAKHLEAFLAGDPNADEVLRRLNESSTWALIEMRSNPKLSGLAARILSITEETRRSQRLDDERTLELVRDVERRKYSREGKVRWATWDAQKKLRLIGGPAVPYLIDHLGDENQDILRSVVFQTLVEIDEEAVLPLMKGLSHESDMVRSNIAAALGQIGDVRAIPALKALWESSPDGLVKTSCDKALTKITGQSAAGLPEARVLYLKQAEDFLRRSPRVMRTIEDELYLVYSWNGTDSKIRRSEVPGYIWHLEVAEEMAHRALEVPGQLPAEEVFPLLAVIYYSQLEVIENLMDKAKARGEDSSKLAAHHAELAKADMFGSIFGTDTLHNALRIALGDNDSGLARRINNALVAIDANLTAKE